MQGMAYIHQGKLNMDKVVLHINGKKHIVSCDLPPDLSLAEYVRDVVGLTGTKLSCGEGGCGACVVAVTKVDPVTQKSVTQAVNSCRIPVFSCHGWHVTTIEGLGSKKSGLHPIQTEIVNSYGSQCGFCTPGFVMSTYSLLCNNKHPSKAELDKCLDGNICRCTGYRSILDGMRNFAKGDKLANTPVDIEDLGSRCQSNGASCPSNGASCPSNGASCPSNGASCPSNGASCPSNGVSCSGQHCSNDVAYIQLREGMQLLRPTSLSQLYTLLQEYGQKARIVAGDTAKGIFKEPKTQKYLISINEIEDLFAVEKTSSGLRIGGGLSVTSLIDVLGEHSKQPGYTYLTSMLPYLSLIGNKPIRNVASWAGNIMIQYFHRDFPSDVFTAMEAANCKITIGSVRGSFSVSPSALLTEDLNGKVLVAVTFPSLPENTKLFLQKVMPNATNSYAYVNCGFLIHLENNTMVHEAPRIVYGGLGSQTIHAKQLENFLCGKNLGMADVVQGSLECLQQELNVDNSTHGGDAVYRKNVAENLFFKFVHGLKNPNDLLNLERPVSTAQTDLQTIAEKFPVTQSRTKIEADILATGEARFCADQPPQKGQLEAYVVMSKEAKGTLDSVDITQALKCPGVHCVLTAKDIPEFNTYQLMFTNTTQEHLASSCIEYSGQPVAVVVADSRCEAKAAAERVQMNFSNVETPITDMKEAIAKGYMHKDVIPEKNMGNVEEAFSECDSIIEGDLDIASQFQFYLEQHTAVVSPVDDGYDVICSTAYPDHTQQTVAKVLGLPINSINLSVPRMGGSFGGKDVAPPLVAALAAVAANKTNKSVRIVWDLSQSMKGPGLRFPVRAVYKVGVKKSGHILALAVDWYQDQGAHCTFENKLFLSMGLDALQGALQIPNQHLCGYAVKTDHAASGAMRAPGPMPAAIIINSIMAHVSHSLKMDLMQLFEENFVKLGDLLLSGQKVISPTLPDVWSELKQRADLHAWKNTVEDFNKSHRYIKRGLGVTSCLWQVSGWPMGAVSAYVTIYTGDGTVAVSVSAVEFGQGLFTKMAQLTAKALGVSMDKVTVKPTNTLIGSNSSVTAGSKDAEYCGRSVIECCKILNERLDPVRKANPEADWRTILMKCQLGGINLAAHNKYNDLHSLQYQLFGAAAAEAEVDLLTGEHKINRVDVLLDYGESINPEIDRGQIEGALIQGLGYMLKENIAWDKNGQLISDSTWEYKVPSVKDIPVDMRVYMLKDSPNTQGIMPAKAVGEPPVILTPVFLNAVRAAISASHKERGINTFCKLDVPATIDRIQAATKIDLKINSLIE